MTLPLLLSAVLVQLASPPPAPPAPAPHRSASVGPAEATHGTKKAPSPGAHLAEDSPERIEAAERFAEGEVAFEQGNYEAAAEAFARAQALSPHPDTLYNLGLAQFHAGHLLEAWNVFDELLRAEASGLTHADARRQTELLRRRLAFVSIPAATTMPICFDGTRLGPDEERPTLPGNHRVATPKMIHSVSLQAGRVYVLDVRYFESAPPPPAPHVLPWIAVAAGSAFTSLGLGIAAARVQDDTPQRGLAVGAASLAGLAMASSVVAIVVHKRKPKVPPPRPSLAPC